MCTHLLNSFLFFVEHLSQAIGLTYHAGECAVTLCSTLPIAKMANEPPYPLLPFRMGSKALQSFKNFWQTCQTPQNLETWYQYVRELGAHVADRQAACMVRWKAQDSMNNIFWELMSHQIKHLDSTAWFCSTYKYEKSSSAYLTSHLYHHKTDNDFSASWWGSEIQIQLFYEFERQKSSSNVVSWRVLFHYKRRLLTNQEGQWQHNYNFWDNRVRSIWKRYTI